LFVRKHLTTALICVAAFAPLARADQFFTNEALFTTALGGATPVVEDFESSPGGSGNTRIFSTVTVSCQGSAYCPGFFGTRSIGFGSAGQTVYFASPDSITFVFGSAITAFGIDIWDLGTAGTTDFSATLSNGSSQTLFSSYSGSFGNGLFVGVTATTPFTSITFTGTADGDGIDFDRMQIASAPSAVPEPATSAIVGLGLGAIALVRRRLKK
jgi:hypothetical protein